MANLNRTSFSHFTSTETRDILRHLAPAANAVNNSGVTADNLASSLVPGSNAIARTTSGSLTAAQSGITVYLNSATGFATTLPAPAAGLKYSFIVTTAPTSGNHTIVTSGSANIIQGFSLVMADAAGVAAVNEDSINLIANQAVVGDRVDIESNGTNWYVVAKVSVAAACTFTAA